MTQHTPTPKLYAFQNVVTDKENYSFDENGTRYGDTPNIAFQMETPEQAAFIVRACNSHDVLVAALERCGKLFSEIRGDWTDPRYECREGQTIVSAALALAKVSQ